MKNGKYINLGVYENIKIGYGTVDYRNLKTIYIKFNSWLEPMDFDVDYQNHLLKSRKKIKNLLYNEKSEYFKLESIVDLDVKTKGLKPDKKSFMDLDITLFVSKQFEIKNKQIREHIKSLTQKIIDDCLLSDVSYKFYKKKN